MKSEVQSDAAAQPAQAAVRPGVRLIALSALFALALASAGYWWTGTPASIGAAPHGSASAASEAAEVAEFTGMVDKLAQRMDQEPSAEGLAMLGRSYLVLGRAQESVAAYQRALKMQPESAALLADLADALAVRNERNLSGEPMALIERALKIEPDNLKALMLAGSEAFNRKDFVRAAEHWQRLVDKGPGEHPLVQQAVAALDEARQRAGSVGGAAGPRVAAAPAVTGAAAPAAAVVAQVAAPPAPPAAPAAPAVLSGTVSLAPAVKAQVSPEDTVFIFARAAQGPRAPLAVLRKQVKDLPVDFRLDDSLAMSPASRLSGAAQVVIGARVSKSGNATPQPGDHEVLSAPMAPHASGLKLVIGEAPAR